jgi:hypothetical protein
MSTWYELQKKHPAICSTPPDSFTPPDSSTPQIDLEWRDRLRPTAPDDVNHPKHYASGSVECIDAIEASMTREAFSGYCKGNCQKYLWRYLDKGGVQSLLKCQWYLQRLIDTENNAL